ncbi:MAG: hypothetical protein QOG97_2741 [Acidimicrobiaceae bacterium]|nr:hypothetical protein [Acidimicrobiaceae bacterium]
MSNQTAEYALNPITAPSPARLTVGYESADGSGGATWAYRTHTPGTGWSAPRTMTTTGTAFYVDQPAIASDGAILHEVLPQIGDPAPMIYQEDTGRSTGRPVSLGLNYAHPAIALDRTRTSFVAAYSFGPPVAGVVVWRIPAGARSVAAPFTLEADTTTGPIEDRFGLPVVSADGSGGILAVWGHQSSNNQTFATGPGDLRWSDYRAGKWSIPATVPNSADQSNRYGLASAGATTTLAFTAGHFVTPATWTGQLHAESYSRGKWISDTDIETVTDPNFQPSVAVSLAGTVAVQTQEAVVTRGPGTTYWSQGPVNPPSPTGEHCTNKSFGPIAYEQVTLDGFADDFFTNVCQVVGYSLARF